MSVRRVAMSMKLGIASGSMEITDDNKTIVSSDIAKEINDSYEQSDNTSKKPELQIKD